MCLPEPLKIANYPWPTIDANDLLRRVKVAEAHVADSKKEGSPNRALTLIAGHLLTPEDVELDPDAEAYAWSPAYKTIAEHLQPPAPLPGFDYNDQCDLAFGRITRLSNEKPEEFDAAVAGELVEMGLDVEGLGLSGEQVSMAFEQVKTLRALAVASDELADDAIEVAEDVAGMANDLTMVERSELDAILTGAGIEPRSTVEGVEGGDLVGRTLRLVASRGRAEEQWREALAALDGERDAAKAATEDPATVPEAPA